MRSTGKEYRTYRGDVLVTSANAGNTYRLTNAYSDDLGTNPITATFRPSGYSKKLQIKVRYGSLDLNGDMGQGIEVLSQLVDEISRKVLGERTMYKGWTRYKELTCPMCVRSITKNVDTGRWKCGNKSCGFDYSPNSCKELNHIYSKAVRGLNNPHMLGVLASSFDNLQITQLQ